MGKCDEQRMRGVNGHDGGVHRAPVLCNRQDRGSIRNPRLLFLLLAIPFMVWGSLGQAAEEAPTPIKAAAADASTVTLPQGTWTVSGATHAGVALDVSGETEDTRATDFTPDGKIMFVLGRKTANVAAYELATPWDISTATFVHAYNGIGRNVPGREAQGSVAHGLYFRKSDGRKMYIWNRTEGFEYDLVTPWDITTAVPTGYKRFDDIVQRGHDIDLKPDGTKLYVDDRDAGAVFQFELTNPWDLTSAVLEYEFDISDWQKQVRGIQFSPDGLRLFILDTVHSTIFEYRLDTAWELDGAASYAAFDVRRSDPRAVTWRPDGRAFFVTERDGGVIHAYNAASEKDDSDPTGPANANVESTLEE